MIKFTSPWSLLAFNEADSPRVDGWMARHETKTSADPCKVASKYLNIRIIFFPHLVPDSNSIYTHLVEIYEPFFSVLTARTLIPSFLVRSGVP